MKPEEERICPYCLRPLELDADGKCKGVDCRQEVRLDDWPEIPGRPDLHPCSAKGLGAKPEEGFPYRPRTLEQPGKGALNTGISREIPENGVWRIGSRYPLGDENVVQISGIPEYQAAVVRRRSDGSWWVFDFGNTDCGTFLNHRRVEHLQRLDDGDLIVVGGVRLKFERGVIKKALRAGSADNDAVTVRNLSAQMLEDISFSVREGEFIGIIGPSGCGKSSLIQRLAGLAGFYDGGEVTVGGIKLRHDKTPTEEMDRLRDKLGYLPQNVELSLHDELTLEQEVDCFCRIHSIRSTSEKRDEILRKFGLLDKKGRKIAELSGGEKRRLGIVLAMLRNPSILFLDEPCAGLDPQSESELMKYVFHLCVSESLTVLCVTHSLASAYLFDKLIVLASGGRLVDFHSPVEVMLRHGIGSLDGLYEKLTAAGAKDKPKNAVPQAKSGLAERWRRIRDGLCEKLTDAWWRRIFARLSKPKFDAGVFKGYLMRTAHQAVGRDGALLKNIMAYLVQPLVIAVGIRLACAGYFRASASGGPLDSAGIVAFCATLSMFWIGINNSARELVRERVPGRCLERLENVPLTTYLAAKFTWMLVLCGFQSLAFYVFLNIAGSIPVSLSGWGNGEISSLTFPLQCAFPLFSASLAGATLGFVVSAAARAERTAVMWVPNIAILALLLSPVIIPIEDRHTLFVSCVAPVIKAMPCHWPSKWFCDAQMLRPPGDAAAWAIALCIGYIAIFVPFAAALTDNNERAWEGRGKDCL